MGETKTRRQIILDVVSDAVSDLLYYDRKEDSQLPRGAIEEAVAAGEISYDEIVAEFRAGLEPQMTTPTSLPADAGRATTRADMERELLRTSGLCWEVDPENGCRALLSSEPRGQEAGERAEVERLREALERVRTVPSRQKEPCPDCYQSAGIAYRALIPQEAGETYYCGRHKPEDAALMACSVCGGPVTHVAPGIPQGGGENADMVELRNLIARGYVEEAAQKARALAQRSLAEWRAP